MRKWILRFFTKQINLRCLGSRCVKGNKESTLEVDSSARFDLGLICLEKRQNPFSDFFRFKKQILDFLKGTHPWFPHFTLVHTSISNRRRLILQFESRSYSIRNDDHSNNTSIHCRAYECYHVVLGNIHVRLCLDPRDLNRAVMREHFPMQTVEDVISRMSNANLFGVLDANHSFWQV